jgi:hypothetical protein
MKIALITLMLLMALVCSTAFGADKLTGPSQEQRNTMATAHENMAACLRSDKSLDICHKEMMKVCMDTMGAEGCSHKMKKKGHMGKCKMHKAMMKADE